MRRLVVLVIVPLLFLGCSSEKETPPGQRTVLKIGTHATYPPFESVNALTGRLEGFDIDLITEICKLNGWKPQFIMTAFDSLVPGLVNREYDVIIAAMTSTAQRAAVVDFTEPYYQTGQIIAVPLDDSTIYGVDDLVGKRVGVQLGTTGESIAKKMDGLHVYLFNSISDAFSDMAYGNLDAVLNDFPSTGAYIKKHGLAKTVGEILSTERYGIAVRKNDQKLLDDINQAWKVFKRSRSFRDIHLKWFGEAPTEKALADSSLVE